MNEGRAEILELLRFKKPKYRLDQVDVALNI